MSGDIVNYIKSFKRYKIFFDPYTYLDYLRCSHCGKISRTCECIDNGNDYDIIIKLNYIIYLSEAYSKKYRLLFLQTKDITNNEICELLIQSSCFLYLITHNKFLTKLYKYYFDFDFDNTKMKFFKKYLDMFYILNGSRPINIKLNYQSYSQYDEILKQLDNLKNIKNLSLIKLFKQSIKFAEYAEEECLASEKLLNVIAKQNTYDKFNDDIATYLIVSPIQKHTFCMSMQTMINMPEISINVFEHEFKIIYNKMICKPLT